MTLYGGEIALQALVADEPNDWREVHRERVTTRLEVGGSAYCLVPIDSDAYAVFALYGAAGPPLEWVHLCDVQFEDARGLLAKAAWVTVGWPVMVVDHAVVLSMVAPWLPSGIGALL